VVAVRASGRVPAAPRSAALGPLAGYTVAVATDRRRHELARLLEAVGARTVGVQAVRSVAQPDVAAIREANLACVAEPVHEVVVSSAFGLRAWLDVARRSGHVDSIVARFGQARLLARDARTADGLRELGLSQIWSTAAATTEDLFRYLIAQPMTGRRVVVQLDSEAQRELCQALRTAGAEVVEVATAQARPPNHMDVLRRLGDLVIRRQVDAVALTSAATTDNLLQQAAADGALGEVLNALVSDVAAACLGPLAAAPLRAKGLSPLLAAEAAMDSLVDLLVAELPQRAMVLDVGGHRIEVRGQGVVIGSQLVPIQPGPIAVLRALALRPGRVLSAAEIRALVPTWSAVDDHAIEMAVSRLRRSLGGTDLEGVELVQTVMRRGYRLAT